MLPMTPLGGQEKWRNGEMLPVPPPDWGHPGLGEAGERGQLQARTSVYAPSWELF